MPTRSFEELVQRHVRDDPAFAEALLREGVDALLRNEIDVGRTILRDYLNAEFQKHSGATRMQGDS